MNQDVKQIYTLQEVAELCKMSRRTVYRYVSSGKLRASKPFGTEWRVSAEDLQNFMNGGN